MMSRANIRPSGCIREALVSAFRSWEEIQNQTTEDGASSAKPIRVHLLIVVALRSSCGQSVLSFPLPDRPNCLFVCFKSWQHFRFLVHSLVGASFELLERNLWPVSSLLLSSMNFLIVSHWWSSSEWQITFAVRGSQSPNFHYSG